MKAAFLAVAVLATASVAFYFSAFSSSATAHASKTKGMASGAGSSAAQVPVVQKSPSTSLNFSLPMFFEANQGQTAAPVKFLARGSGYGLFLTADEAVLELQRPAAGHPSSVAGLRPPERGASSVIRMRLEGASSSARVSGTSPLPGKSNYFIGNDPSQWRQNIPQFGRVEYSAVYPGIDLVYYGDQGQLEYDFRVAPGSDPKQIALSFQGASARIDAGASGDLILSTEQGDVRFRAPRIYQPASGNASGNGGNAITGGFRQLAGNKIGFAIGDYDHSRELVIDPVLSYSTYLGGGGESLAQVAVDTAGNIYVAGSTTSANFPLNTQYPNNPPYQSTLNGTQNIFIAVINPTLQPPLYIPAQQLVYATYLGGSGTDSLAGLAVDNLQSIYVAGSTDSPNFPVSVNSGANGVVAPFQSAPSQPGTHGFLSKLAFSNPLNSAVYELAYSTYLSGTNAAANAVDLVTGVAIDSTAEGTAPDGNAYVTGTTTSTNLVGDFFPANPNGFQQQSNAAAGQPQFFATLIDTDLPGTSGVTYSTYFGGGVFAPDAVIGANVGGGIAVDSSGNMYITGTTNMLPGTTATPGGFPLYNAQQDCLDEPGNGASCLKTNQTNTDAFIAEISPTSPGANPLYSTYVGGSDADTGNAIAVDTSANAYVTGSTYSPDWVCNCGVPFQTAYGGDGDAYIVKIESVSLASGGINTLQYFTYLGGSGADVGNAIQVDAVQTAHVAGTTSSTNFPVTPQTLQATNGGGNDAFVALISTTSGGTVTTPLGDYVTYLGGSGNDEGTGVAFDLYGSTYVAGSTKSQNFPLPPLAISTPFQSTLIGTQNAFVSRIGAVSSLLVQTATGSPQPSPAVAAGVQAAFTFNITNTGPDTATNIIFYGTVATPNSDLASPPTGKVDTGSGSCNPEEGNVVQCFISTLQAGSVASVEIDMTADISAGLQQMSVSGAASANNGALYSGPQQIENVVDFNVAASNQTPTVTAGDVATIQVSFCPTPASLQYGGYSGTITPTQTTSPSIVTATAPTFTPTTVALNGSQCGNTTLKVATVARPVNTGSLIRRGSFYAAWLPVAGLSLVGLGIGAGRKRRRWLIGAVLGMIAGVILLQSACGSASTTTTTTGGTAAGIYTITVTGTAGAGASHATQVTLQVN